MQKCDLMLLPAVNPRVKAKIRAGSIIAPLPPGSILAAWSFRSLLLKLMAVLSLHKYQSLHCSMAKRKGTHAKSLFLLPIFLFARLIYHSFFERKKNHKN
jgi:hypothetical protein